MNDEPQVPPASEAPQDHLLQKYQQQSFVLGLISVVASFWIAPLGLGLGIAGLVHTNKARQRSAAIGETPPRRFMPQFVLGLLGTIVGGITVAVFAIAIFFALPSIGAIFDGMFKTSSEYPKAVATLEAAKKDFTTDEVVEFGPFDIKIRDVQKNYTPTGDEVSRLREGVVYTKFTADVSYNVERGASYDRLMMDVRGWGDALGRPELDGTLCGTYPTPKELEKYDAKYKDGYKDTTTVTYLCSGAAEGAGKFTMDVSLFSKVSPIVGTEGMPRKYVTYSVQL